MTEHAPPNPEQRPELDGSTPIALTREVEAAPAHEQVHAESGIEHLESGSGVSFALLPGQRFEVAVSSEGIIGLRVTSAEPHSEAEAPAQAVNPPQTSSREQAEQARVTISGRVGNTPTFRTTSRGVRVARLVVAEHADTESTAWRTVLTFGKRAEALEQRPLEKGQAVEVIGYPHQREVTTNGVKKTVEEIYATAIKRR